MAAANTEIADLKARLETLEALLIDYSTVKNNVTAVASQSNTNSNNVAIALGKATANEADIVTLNTSFNNLATRVTANEAKFPAVEADITQLQTDNTAQ